MNVRFPSLYSDECVVAPAKTFAYDCDVVAMEDVIARLVDKRVVQEAFEDDALIILGIMDADQHRIFMKYCRDKELY